MRKQQRGVTLIIGLIMIVLITIIVVNAFTLSSGNLKAVGNMQTRQEAIAAANNALEQVIASPFTDAPVAQEFLVDINKDGVNDYTVNVQAPACMKAVVAAAGEGCDSEHPELCSGTTWLTDWDMDATVIDNSTGTSVRVRQGVRVQLSDTRRTAVCPS